ncbi:MAG: Lrp/AsnC ligand binding domain-containing protein [Candidatus Bathyarchaeia archaeon]
MNRLLGKILTIINIFVEPKEIDDVVEALIKMPEVVDVYEVTGEFDIVALIEAENIFHFRNLLKNKILTIKGIKSTVTSVILHTHKKSGELLA